MAPARSVLIDPSLVPRIHLSDFPHSPVFPVIPVVRSDPFSPRNGRAKGLVGRVEQSVFGI